MFAVQVMVLLLDVVCVGQKWVTVSIRLLAPQPNRHLIWSSMYCWDALLDKLGSQQKSLPQFFTSSCPSSHRPCPLILNRATAHFSCSQYGRGVELLQLGKQRLQNPCSHACFPYTFYHPHMEAMEASSDRSCLLPSEVCGGRCSVWGHSRIWVQKPPLPRCCRHQCWGRHGRDLAPTWIMTFAVWLHFSYSSDSWPLAYARHCCRCEC